MSSHFAARKPLTVLLLISFSLMIVFNGYEYGQAENPLVRAQILFSQGQYDAAVKILEDYVSEVKSKADQKANLASAWYLLAKIYYEIGDDAQCDKALLEVYTALPGFDRDEPNFGLREHVTKIKAQLAVSIPVAAETTQGQKTDVQATEAKTATAVTPIEPKTTETVQGQKPDAQAAVITTTPMATPVEPKIAAPLPAKVEPTIVEKPKPEAAVKVKKKKKFPWLLVIGAAIIVGTLVYFFVIKKPKYKLTVSVGDGITVNANSPGSGTFSHKKGTVVSYSYALKSGFKNPVVLIDNVSSNTLNGSITMNSDHKLEVRATPLANFTLTVTKGDGVDGTPNQGTHTYLEGTQADYNYYVKAGYKDLQVRIDGTLISGIGETSRSGSILMNSNHTISVTATLGPVEVTHNNLSAATGNWLYFTIYVPAGRSVLNIFLIPNVGATGDADLFVKYGSQPSLGVFDFSSQAGGLNTDSVSISNPSSGTWHIGVYAWLTFSSWRLYITYQ